MHTLRGVHKCVVLLVFVLIQIVTTDIKCQATTTYLSSNSAVISGNAALDNQDYTAALLYFNQAISADSNNGEAYLGRAQVELLFDEPSLAEQDALQAAQLLRQSSICDNYLPQDSPLLLSSSNNTTLTSLNSITVGTILNPISTLGLASTLTTTGASDTDSTSSTSSTTETSSTTSSSVSSSSLGTAESTATTTTTATSLNASAAGSQNLPVSDDITTRETAQNNSKNQYYLTALEQSVALTVCLSIYSTNEAKLIKTYTVMGMAALSAGDYTVAQNAFSAVLFLKPDNGIGHAGLGLAYLSQGSSSAALTELNTGVQDDPTNPDAYIARGVYWAKIEDTNRAQEDFQTALQLDPSSARAYNALGVLAVQQENYQAGINYYTKALSINSYYVVVYYNRAAAWEALAGQTTDTTLSSQYNQNATNDTEKAQSIQSTATSSSSATTSTTSTDTMFFSSFLTF